MVVGDGLPILLENILLFLLFLLYLQFQEFKLFIQFLTDCQIQQLNLFDDLLISLFILKINGVRAIYISKLEELITIIFHQRDFYNKKWEKHCMRCSQEYPFIFHCKTYF